MKVLLVEPDYYTKYPPLGLMKLASFHKSQGDEVSLVRGLIDNKDFNPDIIKITSLFTYAWKPVHKAIEFYHNLYPNAKVEVGGIYASIMPERISAQYPYVYIHIGLFKPAERYLPDYDILKTVKKWSEWDSSILFASRGCIRRCPFCVVPKLEGKINSVKTSIKDYIYPGHKKIVLWDNNFLASPKCKEVIKELQDIGLVVDFNQGLDARLIDEEKARMLADLKIEIYRLACDSLDEADAVKNAVKLLSNYGIRGRSILIYSMYNFFDNSNSSGDSPSEFLTRLNCILGLKCVAYPMRFEPLDSLTKGQYISPLWANYQLEAIAKARRVIGYGGAFPPYEGLVNKFKSAKNFDDAFRLRLPRNETLNDSKKNTNVLKI